MIKFLKVGGLTVNNPDLPKIILTPEGQAIGHIPGWKCFIDPNYVDGNSVVNRAIKTNYMSPGTTFTEANFSTFQNGEKSFNVLDFSGAPATALLSSFSMNPEQWTMFAVVSCTITSPLVGGELFRPADVTTTGLGPRLTIRTAGGFTLFNTNATSIRAEIPSAITSSAPTLLMATFSTRDGVKLYKNGQLGATNAEDKTPLSEKYSTGQFYLMRSKHSAQSSMKVGMMGVLDVDLGQSENAGYRRQLENFLITKYGITV